MISRITDQMILSNSQANLQTQLQQLSVLQNESSSGLAITKPSDNPTGIGLSLAIKRQQAANAQYASNATDASNWLTSVSGALSSTVSSLQSVRSLVVGTGDASLSATAKASIVSQLQGLKGELLSQANTTYLGRPVFAGNSDGIPVAREDVPIVGFERRLARRTRHRRWRGSPTAQQLHLVDDGANAWNAGGDPRRLRQIGGFGAHAVRPSARLRVATACMFIVPPLIGM